jgi:hypothetical protein
MEPSSGSRRRLTIQVVSTCITIGASIVIGVSGCAPAPMAPAITFVGSTTPGLKYVVVHPRGQKSREDRIRYKDGTSISRASDYIVLCDARPADGMHCDIPPEIGTNVISKNPTPRPPGYETDLGVGTLDGGGVIEQSAPAASSAPLLPLPAPSASAPKGKP